MPATPPPHLVDLIEKERETEQKRIRKKEGEPAEPVPSLTAAVVPVTLSRVTAAAGPKISPVNSYNSSSSPLLLSDL
ncbi:hypothetical protein HanPSC8_Chr14g0616111 [Helianthus annuus]|nr:hypothetical protein HanPSC8_Chr14g0616111 [Helianthus annuus]